MTHNTSSMPDAPGTHNVNLVLSDEEYGKVGGFVATSNGSLTLEQIETAFIKSGVEELPSGEKLHQLDSAGILAITFLLVLSVVTIWAFKYKRFKYVHESGLSIVYGSIIGIIVRYVDHFMFILTIHLVWLSMQGNKVAGERMC